MQLFVSDLKHNILTVVQPRVWYNGITLQEYMFNVSGAHPRGTNDVHCIVEISQGEKKLQKKTMLPYKTAHQFSKHLKQEYRTSFSQCGLQHAYLLEIQKLQLSHKTSFIKVLIFMSKML